MELADVDAKRIRTISTNYFVHENELALGLPDEAAPRTDGYVVAGYPSTLYTHRQEGRWIYQAGGLALIGSPRFEDEHDCDTQFIELPYGNEGRINPATAEPIDLEGCSGGGCWALGASRAPWSARNMRLVGIHVGRSREHVEPRLREILIGHFLALIARGLPNMEWLFDAYPALQNW